MRKPYLFLLLLLVIACGPEEDTLSNDRVITISGLNEESYPVDPYNKVNLNISIAAGSANKFRKLKMESTGGTFSPAALVFPDTTDQSTVQFIPGLTPGVFDIKVSVDGKPEIFVVKTIKLEAQSANDVFRFTFPTSTTAANGKNLLTGEIEVLNSNVLSFTLKSTDATSLFLPEGKSEVTINKSSTGKIPFTLKVGTTAGNYFITATAKDTRNLIQEKPFTLTPLSSDQAMDLKLKDTRKLKGNGIDTVVGTVTITDYPITKIKLVTSAGSFAGTNGSKEMQVTPDATGILHFSLVSGTSTSSYYLTAQLDGTNFIKSISIPIETVYPNDIFLEPSAYEIEAGKTITVNAFLLLDEGKPSDQLSVQFKATQNQSGTIVEVGTFRGYPFNSGTIQKATAAFAIDTRKPVAGIPVTISVSVNANNGKVISSFFEIMPK